MAFGRIRSAARYSPEVSEWSVEAVVNCRSLQHCLTHLNEYFPVPLGGSTTVIVDACGQTGRYDEI